MSDLQPFSLSANGTHQAADPGVTRAEGTTGSLDDQVVEERLDAMMEAVRSWDWRAFTPGDSALRSLATKAAAPVSASPPIEVHHDSEPAQMLEMESIPNDIDSHQIALEQSPRHAKLEEARIEAAPEGDVPRESGDAGPRMAPLTSPTVTIAASSVAAVPVFASQTVHDPQPADPQAETAASIDKQKRFPRIKVAALYAAAGVAVLLIIEGIRLFG